MSQRKHAHYFRSVEHLKEIDIYRFLDLFNVTDQALGHAIKKLVVPGMRGGGKPARKDIEEAIDTLQRRLEMMDEDASPQKPTEPCNQPPLKPWPGGVAYPQGVFVYTRVEVEREGAFGRFVGQADEFDWGEGVRGRVTAWRCL